MADETSEPTPDELREVLATVVEVLRIPYAATMAGEDVRKEILARRTIGVTSALEHFLERKYSLPVSHDVAYLRGLMAEMPATGYVTSDLARARREAGETYDSSIREDFPGVYDQEPRYNEEPTKESEQK